MSRLAVGSLAALLAALPLCGCSRSSPDDPVTAQKARAAMAERLQTGGRITDKRVLQALREVPRHRLLPKSYWDQAYADQAVMLDAQRAVSAPLLSALIVQETNALPKHKVLMIQPITGYEPALLSKLCSSVVVLVLMEEEATLLRNELQKLGATTVGVHACDIAQGWADLAPYDAVIMATETGGNPPSKIVEQMADRSILVEHSGSYAQRVLVYRMKENDLVFDHSTALQ